MSDMQARWAAAKVGKPSIEEDGRRVWCVYVECEGDPRAEVLGLLDGTMPLVTTHPAGVVLIEGVADPRGPEILEPSPKRKRAKKEAP